MSVHLMTVYMLSKPKQERCSGLHQPMIAFTLRLLLPAGWFTLARMTPGSTPFLPQDVGALLASLSGLPPPGLVSLPHLLLPTACFTLARMTASSMPLMPQDAGALLAVFGADIDKPIG